MKNSNTAKHIRQSQANLAPTRLSQAITNLSRNWRNWSGASVLVCALGTLAAPSFAAKEAADLQINLVGAEIETVIKTVGQLTNTTFVIDPRVKGNMNLVSEKPLTKSQAFALLASHLRLQGFTIVTGDGFSKVVPEGDAKLQSSPTIATNHGRVQGDQIATQIFRLNYESSMNLVTILRPLISPNNSINANPGNNTLVITDYADNLSRLGKIIAALDAPSAADLDIIPVRHAVASDLAVMINRLMEPSGAGADSGRVSVLADSRTNNLILRAPSVARANLAKSLIAKLDQPSKNPGNVHVVYLKNADATKLAQTLRAVVSSDSSSSAASASSSSSSTPPPSTGMTGSSPAPTTPSNFGGSNGNTGLSSGGAAGFIQADTATNTLIITANEATYRNLRNVIDQLDVRRVQVYIESMIVEVTSNKAAEFGIQWMGLSGNNDSKYRVGALEASGLATGNNNLVALASGKGKVPPGNGFSLGIFKQAGGVLSLGALAHAIESEDGVNILSTPNLITLDNEEAKIIVGQNVPFVTGQYANSGSSSGTSGATVNPFTTIDRKDVGLQLRVKPQVSEGGTVKLAIYQESSSVVKNTDTTGAGANLITNKRSIETNVLADDGQIVVLGGLIEDTNDDNVEKVPGLGDIPLLGNLFKYQTRSRKKTNLLVFLRPVVLRNSEQSNSLATDRYDLIRSLEISNQPDKKALLPNFGSPVLPSLEKGVPVGGTMAKPVPPAPVRAADNLDK